MYRYIILCTSFLHRSFFLKIAIFRLLWIQLLIVAIFFLNKHNFLIMVIKSSSNFCCLISKRMNIKIVAQSLTIIAKRHFTTVLTENHFKVRNTRKMFLLTCFLNTLWDCLCLIRTETDFPDGLKWYNLTACLGYKKSATCLHSQQFSVAAPVWSTSMHNALCYCAFCF